MAECTGNPAGWAPGGGAWDVGTDEDCGRVPIHEDNVWRCGEKWGVPIKGGFILPGTGWLTTSAEGKKAK